MVRAKPTILLFADAALVEDSVRRPLEEAGFHVAMERLGAEVNGIAPDVILLDGVSTSEAALQLCRRLRTKAAEGITPILFVGAAAINRQAGLEAGADAYLTHPFNPSELLAQVRALLRIKERHDRLAAKTEELQHVHKRLQAAYQQIDMELELARRIQESFLPQSLPELPGVRFAVAYKPQNRVGGDFYDLFRLDESHVGFYVADAMGHGVPASLLTIFVKQAVKAKEINGNEYRLTPPNEVLAKLNRDLIAQALSEHPFITMAYALFDARTGTFRFARAGHPYPLYVPREGPPRFWQIEGSLLGVFETEFRLQAHTLAPGDKVLLYTDGMDAAAVDKQPLGGASLLAAVERHRNLHIDDMIQRLEHDLFGQTQRTDDLTILGMEYVD
ncbi:MAG: SpoIIE family protein phosphatase [Planctomycetes bacterium]|nr:SpoIIE family protein phosphatase [Planctomycetota bacterium]